MIDYSKYTRQELLECLQNIDQERFPENHARLVARFAEVESLRESRRSRYAPSVEFALKRPPSTFTVFPDEDRVLLERNGSTSTIRRGAISPFTYELRDESGHGLRCTHGVMTRKTIQLDWNGKQIKIDAGKPNFDYQCQWNGRTANLNVEESEVVADDDVVAEYHYSATKRDTECMRGWVLDVEYAEIAIALLLI